MGLLTEIAQQQSAAELVGQAATEVKELPKHNSVSMLFKEGNIDGGLARALMAHVSQSKEAQQGDVTVEWERNGYRVYVNAENKQQAFKKVAQKLQPHKHR